MHGVVGEQVPPEPLSSSSPESSARDVRAIRFLGSDHTTPHRLFPSGTTMARVEDASQALLRRTLLLAWDLPLGII